MDLCSHASRLCPRAQTHVHRFHGETTLFHPAVRQTCGPPTAAGTPIRSGAGCARPTDPQRTPDRSCTASQSAKTEVSLSHKASSKYSIKKGRRTACSPAGRRLFRKQRVDEVSDGRLAHREMRMGGDTPLKHLHLRPISPWEPSGRQVEARRQLGHPHTFFASSLRVIQAH